jgi:hypothetical protein
MTAMGEVHAHDRIAFLKQGKLDGHIRLCSGMGLYIRISASEQFLRSLTGKLFHNIHALASAIITVTRISLRIFIRQGAAHRSHNSV